MLSLVYLLLVRLVGVLGWGRRVRQLELENAVLRHQVKVLRRTVRRTPDPFDEFRRRHRRGASRQACRAHSLWPPDGSRVVFLRSRAGDDPIHTARKTRSALYQGFLGSGFLTPARASHLFS
jgi:hypothetical protein